MKDITTFLSQTINNFSTTGAIAPVRRKTASTMVKKSKIAGKSNLKIVEFGPGTGVISDEILSHLCPQSSLILVEANKEFFEFLIEKYEDDDRVVILNEFVQNVEEIRNSSFDVVFNSIPMSLLTIEIREDIYTMANDCLNKRGMFVQYQYSKISVPQLKYCFTEDIEFTYTFSNIIPTWIMTIDREKYLKKSDRKIKAFSNALFDATDNLY